MTDHDYDGCDGGICMKCGRCRHPSCCEQVEECDGVLARHRVSVRYRELFKRL